ncbi:homoserine O-acetyltransferase [Rhodothalassium salexigens DSM 2132]|uniref:Homoserine O-acetyltransferase n=1 Tax=Rhodothalassium salexigens DSM 2132 TaxID=1188247 RepID=A0A4R2PR42_RHOSA|nr:homoserine O-succinyltransferase [Rhodothalassium salexigens]MBB4210159.1 homoserine O-acetyltransferase [Rhodothalassium salexigens DSM 2132]MBK1639314.1 hypothetical protein [Rhodothalassium salexigens DSM 2132]TCP38323.1 homoserine O-acetyltransferase [Rhodothalassium salexigens DSM 2132]
MTLDISTDTASANTGIRHGDLRRTMTGDGSGAMARAPGATTQHNWVARDVTLPLPADFTLDSGERLSEPWLTLRITRGAQVADDAPLVAVAGGISAGRVVARDAGANAPTAWWAEVARPGGGVDLDAVRMLSFDMLPNAGETATTITTNDQARALAAALDGLGVERLAAYIGSSYGGMVGLAFAADHGHRLGRLAVISAAHRPDATATAWRGIQRRMVRFGLDHGDPEGGLALARQLAMTTYRAANELDQRFDCTAQGAHAGDPFDVCEYLIARGEAFCKVMAAERFLTLSDSLDRHRVDPAAIDVPTLLIAARTDRLVSPDAMVCLAARTKGSSRYCVIDTPYGHDAFLKEPEQMNHLLGQFLDEVLAAEAPARAAAS